MRYGKVYYKDIFCGVIKRIDGEFIFTYDPAYLSNGGKSVSLTLPNTKNEYRSNVLFPFFDGLIPEGWLLNIAEETWKIQKHDRFELLLKVCSDPIGCVSIKEDEDDE